MSARRLLERVNEVSLTWGRLVSASYILVPCWEKNVKITSWIETNTRQNRYFPFYHKQQLSSMFMWISEHSACRMMHITAFCFLYWRGTFFLDRTRCAIIQIIIYNQRYRSYTLEADFAYCMRKKRKNWDYRQKKQSSKLWLAGKRGQRIRTLNDE